MIVMKARIINKTILMCMIIMKSMTETLLLKIKTKVMNQQLSANTKVSPAILKNKHFSQNCFHNQFYFKPLSN